MIVYIPVRYNQKQFSELLTDLVTYETKHIDHIKTKIKRVLKIKKYGDKEYPKDSSIWREAVQFFKDNRPLLEVVVPENRLYDFDVIVNKHRYKTQAYLLRE